MATVFAYVMVPLLVVLGVFAGAAPAQASLSIVLATVACFVVGCAVLYATLRLRRLEATS